MHPKSITGGRVFQKKRQKIRQGTHEHNTARLLMAYPFPPVHDFGEDRQQEKPEREQKNDQYGNIKHQMSEMRLDLMDVFRRPVVAGISFFHQDFHEIMQALTFVKDQRFVFCDGLLEERLQHKKIPIVHASEGWLIPICTCS